MVPFTKESPEDVMTVMNETIAPYLIGRDPARIAMLEADLDRIVQGYLTARGVASRPRVALNRWGVSALTEEGAEFVSELGVAGADEHLAPPSGGGRRGDSLERWRVTPFAPEIEQRSGHRTSSNRAAEPGPMRLFVTGSG